MRHERVLDLLPEVNRGSCMLRKQETSNMRAYAHKYCSLDAVGYCCPSLGESDRRCAIYTDVYSPDEVKR